ncbi:hypothetical protein Pst134EB_008047 [Puccinia striiformis f. sp. tritici]|nr:hypothetical protein Pst134EB_008047 [Puccinia striiformis f. sp. tritici]
MRSDHDSFLVMSCSWVIEKYVAMDMSNPLSREGYFENDFWGFLGIGGKDEWFDAMRQESYEREGLEQLQSICSKIDEVTIGQEKALIIILYDIMSWETRISLDSRKEEGTSCDHIWLTYLFD